MPKTKLQEIVFTILMVFVMVYAMICYNIALNEYYGAAEPPVRCGESHLSGLTEPLRSL